MSCPICASPEGSAITEGIRAGALVLIVVVVFVAGLISRFAYKLWTAERAGLTDHVELDQA